MARLVVINQSAAGSVHELGVKWTSIGRADGNTFQLLESSVSGRHCEVRVRDEDLIVRDLLSTNGTFINDHKIVEGVVKPGGKLRLGEVELRFEGSGPAVLSGAPFNSKMLVASVPGPKSVNDASAEPRPDSASEPVPAATTVPAKRCQVLLVDDSMTFLESFGELCEELSRRSWQVHPAVSADRALELLKAQAMDLVVLDVGMPMLDGLQLLSILKRRHPGVKIAVMTGNATEKRRADALENGAEVFLEKPVTPDGMKLVFNVLNDLVSWHAEGFTGALRQVGLPELIQVECTGRHSVVLEIHNPEVSGQIYIEDGVITHATVGGLSGEPAFWRLFSLRGGGFEVKPFRVPPRRSIECGWEHLLMEAARMVDEETASAKQNLPEATPPSVSAKPVTSETPVASPNLQEETQPEETVDHGLGDEIVVVATYDGKWNQNDAATEPGQDAAGDGSKK